MVMGERGAERERDTNTEGERGREVWNRDAHTDSGRVDKARGSACVLGMMETETQTYTETDEETE